MFSALDGDIDAVAKFDWKSALSNNWLCGLTKGVCSLLSSLAKLMLLHDLMCSTELTKSHSINEIQN